MNYYYYELLEDIEGGGGEGAEDIEGWGRRQKILRVGGRRY